MQFWHILGNSNVGFLLRKGFMFWKVGWILLDGRQYLISFFPRWMTELMAEETAKMAGEIHKPTSPIYQPKQLAGSPQCVN